MSYWYFRSFRGKEGGQNTGLRGLNGIKYTYLIICHKYWSKILKRERTFGLRSFRFFKKYLWNWDGGNVRVCGTELYAKRTKFTYAFWLFFSERNRRASSLAQLGIWVLNYLWVFNWSYSSLHYCWLGMRQLSTVRSIVSHQK